ncbi:MAG: fatty acyl-AMP ligase [Roseiflexaceae bacterium]
MVETLVDVLQNLARSRAQDLAYTFLNDGDGAETHLTYGALDCEARALAARLQQTFGPGERALLLFPPGLAYISAFFGCLYAGVIAVPLYPPHPSAQHRSHQRIRAVVADAQAALVLSPEATRAAAPAELLRLDDQSAPAWIASDTIDQDGAASWQPPRLYGDTLAFLQYTSGSTSSPRGVMISHANLLANLAALDASLCHGPDSRFVSWLPHFHDMGLIYGILEPLYKGVPCVLISPAAFAQQPRRWLRAISRYRATHSAAPNFAYETCAAKLSADERADLDLSNWQVALNGAEPIRHETLERFAASFQAAGLRPETRCPGYGLAEATLAVSITHKDAPVVTYAVRADLLEQNRVVAAPPQHPHSRTLVSSGQVVPDTTVAIVDPQALVACPPDHVGEIWVAGPGVAQGYWGRPDETAETFQAGLPGDPRHFLRTGDLGFLRDGELFVTGRIKDLIIIDGRNHYPQDIEQTVERCHAAIRATCCVAFAVERQGAEGLVVLAEIERRYRPAEQASLSVSGFYQPLEPREVLKAIRQAVAEEHDLRVADVVLLKVGGVAKTSSGKIQRRACRTAYLAGELTRWG